MPEEVKTNHELGIIEVISFDKVTMGDIAVSITSVATIYRETSISKVLVDTTAEKSFPSTFEIYQLASNMPTGIQFAIIVGENQPTKSDVQFFITVAQNRGALIKMFSSRIQAFEWLQSDK